MNNLFQIPFEAFGQLHGGHAMFGSTSSTFTGGFFHSRGFFWSENYNLYYINKVYNQKSMHSKKIGVGQIS